MKKQYTNLLVVLLTCTFSLSTVFAQSPEKMSFQAVVRDASNNLVANSNIGMRISILTGSATGVAVYTETQLPTTNANGLVTLEIGTGTTGDDFSAINWETEIYFIKTETDPAGGSNYTITGTAQLLSVPYALHAKTAANTFSGNYSDLIGFPTNVSAFLNDAGYLASFTETDPVFGAHVANGITSTNMTNWTTAYDWGDHSAQGYLASFTETDPVFGAHVANGITSAEMTNWSTAYGWGDHSTQGYLASFTETDPEVGTNTTNCLSKWDGDALVSSSIFDNGNIGIGTNEPSQKLEVDGNISANEFHSGVGASISANYHKFRFGGTITGYAIGVSSSDHLGSVNNWANTFTWRGTSEGYGWLWRNHDGTGWMSLSSYDGGFYLKGKAHFDDNVGIGTASPTTPLEVNGTIQSSSGGFMFPDGTTQTTAASDDGITLDKAYDEGGAGTGRTITADAGAVNITGNDGLTVNGNVGIGTTNPSYPLTIYPGTSTRGLYIDHNQTGAESTFGILVDLDRTGTGNADIYAIRSTATSDNSMWSTRGLMATANGNAAGPKYGVYAVAQGAGVLHGVRGVASSTTTSSQYGVFGEAMGTGTGIHYGVYGTARGGGVLWAGYFNGNVYADGNVGIGTKNPSANLHVSGDDGILFTGTYSTGTIPAEGAGMRMMWYPRKAAFRAGYVNGTQWNDANIGRYSTAMGYSTTANDSYSTAMGVFTTASGAASTALGLSTTAIGNYSTAMGSYINTSGEGSFAIGDHSTTSGAPTFTTDNRFYARFANGYRLYTSSNLSSGATLLPGANSWSSLSDSTKKENFKIVNGEDILNKIRTFKLTSWNYKRQEPTKFRHYGPMAQDFYTAFGYDGIGTIGCDTLLSSADFDGINFIAIQALEKRTKTNEKQVAKSEERVVAEIDKLRDDLISLQEENNELKQKLASMESNLKKFEVFMANSKNKKGESKDSLTALKE